MSPVSLDEYSAADRERSWNLLAQESIDYITQPSLLDQTNKILCCSGPTDPPKMEAEIPNKAHLF